jgi:HK97 family phage major capsid protein
MPTLTDIMSEVQTITHDLRSRVDTLDKEQKKLGEDLTSKTGQLPAEYKSSIDQLNGRIDQLMKSVDDARIAALRPGLPNRDKKNDPMHQAFMKCIRYNGNINMLSNEEKALIIPAFMPSDRKALYASDATTGGFFASTDFVEELQAYQLLISPMRQICRIQKTSGEKVQLPALANDTSAYWATEQSSFTDSADATTAMINIPVHELRGLSKISQQNLEDSMFDLETFLKNRLGMKFSQVEGAAFVAGNGNGKPRGILNYPIKASAGYAGGSAGKNNVTDAIAYVPSGNSSLLTSDSIINIIMDLKSAYARNAKMILTRSSVGAIRLFKDSQNRYLWQPFAAPNLPATIFDIPYVEMPDMPEIGANTYPIIVGDFDNYMIVDRVTFSMAQLNELYAVQGLVGFIARERVGGDVLLPESFRVLKVAVS